MITDDTCNPEDFCPTCGAELNGQKIKRPYNCEAPDCFKIAVWEGWHGHGLIRRMQVCGDHRYLLIGGKKNKTKKSVKKTKAEV